MPLPEIDCLPLTNLSRIFCRPWRSRHLQDLRRQIIPCVVCTSLVKSSRIEFHRTFFGQFFAYIPILAISVPSPPLFLLAKTSMFTRKPTTPFVRSFRSHHHLEKPYAYDTSTVRLFLFSILALCAIPAIHIFRGIGVHQLQALRVHRSSYSFFFFSCSSILPTSFCIVPGSRNPRTWCITASI